jgi:hypothetical protein
MAMRTRFARGAWVVAIVGLSMGIGCGPSTSGDTPDAGASCSSSDPSHCEGQSWLSCEGGKWKSELCPQPNVCVDGLGCRVCKPNSGYCSSQDAYVCSADGTQWNLVQTCRAEEQCVAGGCISVCEQALTTKSNVGCEFWSVDLPMDYQCMEMTAGGQCQGLSYGCAACQQYAVVVANTSDFDVRITVEQNNAAPGEPLELVEVDGFQGGTTAGAHGLAVLNLPQREVDCRAFAPDQWGKMRGDRPSSTCLTSRAYRITTTYPVVAYQFNPIKNDYSNGASLLIPTNALGYDHFILGWYTTNPIGMNIPGGPQTYGIPDFMYVTVVGVMDNTNVQITPTQGTQPGADAGAPVEAVEAGGTINVKLGQFDVLAIASRAPTGVAEIAKQNGDFTGTRVSADKPIVVFSSGQRSEVPDRVDSYNPPAPPAGGDGCCTEHFEQQMFPISSLGKQFVITRTPPRQVGTTASQFEPDFYRVLATKPGTTITTNLADFPTMTIAEAGQYAKFWSRDDFIMESNEPVMVGQYAVAQGYLTGDYTVGGDPEFILFPPYEQHRKEYVFLTPDTFTFDYVIIAAPEGTGVLLDGTDVNVEFGTCERWPAGTLDSKTYNALRCPVADGPHTILATEPVGISVYGYYSVSSYGYPGGADVRDINIQ